jgi:hypothetical protein
MLYDVSQSESFRCPLILWRNRSRGISPLSSVLFSVLRRIPRLLLLTRTPTHELDLEQQYSTGLSHVPIGIKPGGGMLTQGKPAMDVEEVRKTA